MPLKYTYSWFINQFKRAKNRTEKLKSGTNTKYLYHKPAADTWSVVECIVHLNKFGKIYCKRINRKIKQAGTDANSSSQLFKPRLPWRGIIWLFEPPYKVKLKTISIFEPSQQKSLHNGHSFKTFLALQDQFIAQLERCQQTGINLDSKKISNPALPFLKMRLSESYGIVLAHQQRHLWQAEQTLNSISW